MNPAAEPAGYGRRYGIGGSDAAAALGLNPWKSPITLWQELRGELEPFEGNEYTHWGNLLESAIRDEYARRHDVEVTVPTEPAFHPELTWARATPDGLILAKKRGLEIKNVGLRQADHWGAEGSEEVPVAYEIQCRHYMMVTDIDRWDVAVLIGGQNYREFTIHRDAEVERAMLAELAEFWERHVLGDEPPAPDATDEYARFLLRRYATPVDDFARADAATDEVAVRLFALKSQLKKYEAEKKLLENQLREAVGNFAGLDTSLGRIKDIRVKGRETVRYQDAFEELAASLPPDERLSLIAKHTHRGAGYRRFGAPKEMKR